MIDFRKENVNIFEELGVKPYELFRMECPDGTIFPSIQYAYLTKNTELKDTSGDGYIIEVYSGLDTGRIKIVKQYPIAFAQKAMEDQFCIEIPKTKELLQGRFALPDEGPMIDEDGKPCPDDMIAALSNGEYRVLKLKDAPASFRPFIFDPVSLTKKRF